MDVVEFMIVFPFVFYVEDFEVAVWRIASGCQNGGKDEILCLTYWRGCIGLRSQPRTLQEGYLEAEAVSVKKHLAKFNICTEVNGPISCPSTNIERILQIGVNRS